MASEGDIVSERWVKLDTHSRKAPPVVNHVNDLTSSGHVTLMLASSILSAIMRFRESPSGIYVRCCDWEEIALRESCDRTVAVSATMAYVAYVAEHAFHPVGSIFMARVALFVAPWQVSEAIYRRVWRPKDHRPSPVVENSVIALPRGLHVWLPALTPYPRNRTPKSPPPSKKKKKEKKKAAWEVYIV